MEGRGNAMSQTYTVELDFRATFQVELEADSPAEAYKRANKILHDGEDLDFGKVLIDRVDSFQVMDERMQPVEVKF